MDEKNYPIAQRNDLYWEEIRNPELAQCAEEIEDVCRKYGIRDIEFKSIMQEVEQSLYTFIDFMSDDDPEDELEE